MVLASSFVDSEAGASLVPFAPASMPVNMLQQAALCFDYARRQLFEGTALLYKIREERLWADKYVSFSDYLLSECHISDGFASRLLKVYEHYCVQGDFPREKLEGIDHERLYMAIELKMPVDQQFLRAKIWSRQEIKAELAEKGGVEHECEAITICKICSKRMYA